MRIKQLFEMNYDVCILIENCLMNKFYLDGKRLSFTFRPLRLKLFIYVTNIE